MLDDAHAFWLRAPGRGEIRPVALPEPGHGDVVVRTLRSGVSRGTETLVFRGGVPASQYAAMRAPFQEGDFPGPVKYGYLNVGAVAGHAAAGMSRHDLKDLGEHLDAGTAGLVVVAVSDMGAKVERAMERAAKLEQKELKADTAAIERDAASASEGAT